MKTGYTVYLGNRAVDSGTFEGKDNLTTRDVLQRIKSNEICADTGKVIRTPLCDGMTVRIGGGEWYIKLNSTWWELVSLP